AKKEWCGPRSPRTRELWTGRMIEALLAGFFGLLIGSFLNVCIHRWPRDLSVVAPRSRCPLCDRQISWYDNVPVLSYVILGGRCRACRAPIHWRYPLVELLTGASFAWFAGHFGLSLATLKYCIFAAIIIGLIFSDLDTLILPDEFTIGGLLIGLAFSPFVVVPDSTFAIIAELAGFRLGSRASSVGEALFGAFLPAAGLWFLGWAFEKLRHKEGLGFGDVKMIAAVGAFLGIRGVLFTVIVGSVVGSIVGLTYIRLASKDAATYQLPFGTFLGLGALLAALGGQMLAGALV
ncbi:MAG TPA: prepilin peptidase, partial [Bryobacteraceae bacterium]|nr:prepilin peptidase [Bryobacteraceae bacterium]